LTKPIEHVELRSLMEKAVSQSQGAKMGLRCEKIITRSMQMEQLLVQAYRVVKRYVSGLIRGASGTGKELLAMQKVPLHVQSMRIKGSLRKQT
jgi:two-component system response regulator GlrR